MKYIGIYANGVTDERYDLVKLAENPAIEYILKVDEEVNNSGYLYDTCITLINKDGSLRTLTIGGFQLLDIGNRYFDQALQKHFVLLTILETRLDHVFHCSIEYSASTMMEESILPLMNKLNEINSHAAYLLIEENKQLVTENKELRSRLGE